MSAFPPPPPDANQAPAGEPPPFGMAVCEVTGKTVPEDETVVFQGRRVSAEGKQILADRLNAGEAMPGELEDATRLARFGGSVLDSLLFFVMIIGVGAALGIVGVISGNEQVVGRLEAMIAVVAGLIGFAYFGAMHARNGQTLGKMAAKTRVVTADGGDLPARAAWLRAAIYTLPSVVASLPALLLGPLVGETLGNVLDGLAGLFGLVNVLLIFRAGKRCLHDDLAGTRVVTTRV